MVTYQHKCMKDGVTIGTPVSELSLSVEHQPHGQAHLVFADTQPNPKKPKELALTHRTHTE